MDKCFIRALDEPTPEPVKGTVTPTTLIGQICSMIGSGQKMYAVLWNPENYDRAAEDPNWKGGSVCFGYPSFFFGIGLCAMEMQKICDRPHTPNVRNVLYYRFPRS